MVLGLIILALFLVALAFSQAWTVWLLRREVTRLEQRLDESLDDQDLLDFQERLQELLKQARGAGAEMVDSIAKRQEALEKTLVLVKEAEQRLMVRTQVLEKSADAVALRTEKLQAAPAPKAPKAPRPKAPAPKPQAVPVPAPATAPALEPESALVAAETPKPAPASKHQRVYELSDQGLNRDQIAKAAGILAGEVELILNLRPKKAGRA
jgi:hypothetical protein